MRNAPEFAYRPAMRHFVFRWLVTTVGVALGTGGALLGSRVVAGMLFGVGQFDWISYAIALTVVSVGALSAGAVPAARAARVDALVAMRSEA